MYFLATLSLGRAVLSSNMRHNIFKRNYSDQSIKEYLAQVNISFIDSSNLKFVIDYIEGLIFSEDMLVERSLQRRIQ